MLLKIFSDYLNFEKTIFVKLKFTLSFKQVRNPYEELDVRFLKHLSKNVLDFFPLKTRPSLSGQSIRGLVFGGEKSKIYFDRHLSP